MVTRRLMSVFQGMMAMGRLMSMMVMSRVRRISQAMVVMRSISRVSQTMIVMRRTLKTPTRSITWTMWSMRDEGDIGDAECGHQRADTPTLCDAQRGGSHQSPGADGGDERQ